jgi:mannose-6-phosphate isomerase-like protein (cupin superfamily)
MATRSNTPFNTKTTSTASLSPKLPPQNIEAEQSLLGALLIDKDAIIKIADLVAAEDFYHEVDSLPEARPLTKGAWTVPVGARTVTERRAGVRLVVRPAAGQGLAYIGSETVDFQYGYLVIPAETAYYFENTGTTPLDIEFVGIKP